MEITIRIETHESQVAELLNGIATALSGNSFTAAADDAQSGALKPVETRKTTKAKKEQTKLIEATAPTPGEETKPAEVIETEPETTYTLVQVRERLSDLSRAGKQAQVKALIGQFGAAKLSDIKEKDYAALMKEAEEL